MTTLTNVQNSLFVPDLGRFLNRRPTYTLTRRPTKVSEAEVPQDLTRPTRIPTKTTEMPTPGEKQERQEELSLEATRYLTAEEKSELEHPDTQTSKRFKARRTHSLASVMSESQYAVLPHGVSLAGWSQEDKDELNDHVRHLLHSRRARFKRSMRGFGKYVRKRE
jgi:hypothetical protein